MKTKLIKLLQSKSNITEDSHHLFLVWMLFTGLVIFGITIAWYDGLVGLLFATDKSKICYAITGLFAVVSIHCAIRFYMVSNQIDISKNIEQTIRENSGIGLSIDDERVKLNNGEFLPKCFMTDYIHDLLHKVKNNEKALEDPSNTETELIQVYQSRMKAPHEMGWFASDLMIKLGLLGTIIGFVLMMSSVGDIKEFDITAVQRILQKMSVGMGTALYTTLTGLICNMLTTAQYYTLDRKIDQLIEATRHLTEIYIIPKIK